MPQFDVYRNSNPQTCLEIPYLLDVQSDLLESLATRVVVPLVLVARMDKPAKGLNPLFAIEDKTVVMSTTELAGISRRNLGDKAGTLKEQRAEIVAALDLLFTGI